MNSSGGREGTGIGDRKDREGDNGVEDARQAFDTSELDRKNERCVLSVGVRCIKKVGVVGWDNEADDEKTEDVEDCNAEEDLSGSFWKRNTRVRCLGCCETN